MIRKAIYAALIGACSLSACQSSNEAAGTAAEKKDTAVAADPIAQPQSSAVEYITAQNYFVKNTVKPGRLAEVKYDTQEKFDAVFGAAAAMGEKGKPTPIDFTRQYVIGIVEAETDLATEIKLVSLQMDNKDKTIVCAYEVIKGAKQSYTIRPSLILVVDKKDEGTVVAKEVSK